MQSPLEGQLKHFIHRTLPMRFIDRLCGHWLRQRGFQIVAAPAGQVFAEGISNPAEYAGPADFSRYFRPWDVQSELNGWREPKVVDNTMLSPIKLYYLRALAAHACGLTGDFLEAGVHNGGSARLLLNVMQEYKSTKRIWLLDTFQGYSKPSPERDGCHVKERDCGGRPRSYVEQLLQDGGSRVRFVEGAIPGTLTQVQTQELAFSHIDVNLYEPTLTAMEFCLERTVPGGILVFDDYGWPATYGARMAIDEACRKFSQSVISVPETSQAFVIKAHS